MLGYFNDSTKEYVITEMRPRRPLINYLWNETFLLELTHFGFGPSFYRVNPYVRRSLIEGGDASRLIYVKDRESGEFYDANRNYKNYPFDKHECHVGIGYHNVISEYKGVAVDFGITVPQDYSAELWQVKVKNTSDKAKKLSVVTSGIPAANVTGHWAYGHANFDNELGGLYFKHDAFAVDDLYEGVFFKSDIKADSYDVGMVNFKGLYNEWSQPQALYNEQLSCLGMSFEQHYCAALQFDIDLAAGEEKVINIALGVVRSIEEAKAVADACLADGKYESTVKEIKDEADQMDAVYTLKTPDEYLNSTTNTWLKRQISLGKTWGRVYGKGFRDVMQDVAGMASFDIPMARNKILLCLDHMRINGNPIRMFEPDEPALYYDGAAWIPATLLVYLNESGNMAILDEKCKYLDSDIEDSVFDHMHRGIRFLLDNRGKHNMVLWGGGDWNDSINNVGNKFIGESAWLSIATVKAVTEFCEILELMGGKEDLIASLTEEKEVLKAAIIEHALEDDRFIYGINDWGEKLGSEDSKEGKVYLNPQTWAVLADILDYDGLQKVMNTVEEKLKCDFGYVQCAPAYSKKDLHIGRMAYFVPGCYENGSVYNHGVTFKIVADCKLGNADKAYETVKLIRCDNPKNADSGVEPYAVSNMYFGPEEPNRPGYAPCSWITGTAGWLYRGITEYILGVRSEFYGLRVDPCLPSEWDKVEVSRIYRGATYNITIEKTGIASVEMDGKALDSNLLPVTEAGTTHTVKVTY